MYQLGDGGVRSPLGPSSEVHLGWVDAKMESKQNRTMEKRGKRNGKKEGMEGTNKGDGLEFWGGVYDGWEVDGQEGGLGGLFVTWAGNVE